MTKWSEFSTAVAAAQQTIGVIRIAAALVVENHLTVAGTSEVFGTTGD
ncbi:hypothetical protein NKH14_13360 [Mesorhizobium sp. M1380]